ncbi:hypothetical protein FA13DRAFT_685937 [Coprinellus micaceus]|uniref:Nephrocystin 3-like N-terminal domain-containing protein n=1 Tax=Coprinellus micaceus TaxID=71717 RepID=A0A4Y7T4I3_COPMI|nr:hypothetical protein FA13DRAFT_685937 [Coprinellus micaceus]
MTDARRKNEKWEEAVWREVWKREIEALHLLTVSTTRVVNSSMPNLPNPIGPDTNETAASPAEAPQMEAEYPAGLRKVTSVDDSTTHARSEASAAALARFRLSVSFEALADSITEVEQWPRPLKIAIDHSLQGIIAWLKTVQKTKCVYWLWHDRDLPEQFDRSREDILRYVASVCKLQEALGSSYFFPRQATSKSFKESFFPTIVFELSAYIPRFEDLAANACEARGHHFLGRAWMTQAKELIVNQYKLLSTEDRQKPILIIIDSLDRCTRKEVPQLLNALTMCIENLPICILISSKRVQGVEERFNLWKGKDYVVEGELMVDPKDMEDWESKNIRDEKSGGMKEGKSEDSLLDRVGDEFDEELGDPTTPRPGKTFA